MDELQRKFRSVVEEEAWHVSPLAKWMSTHHDQAAALLGDKRMDWAHAASLFAGQGLRDHLAQPPTAETARETWRRVEARRKAGLELSRRKS